MADFEYQKPDYPIKASTVNHGVKAREILENFSVSPPLELIRNSGGIFLRIAMSLLGARVGKTGVGGLTARSGTTMGSGTVTEQNVKLAPTITALSTTYTAYQLSATAVGASKYIVTIKVGTTNLLIWNEC